MVRSWLDGVKRRSVREDFAFYHPPGTVWEVINRQKWNYKNKKREPFYHVRDLAFLCLLWWTSARVSELIRFKAYRVTDEDPVLIGKLPSVYGWQFNRSEKNFLTLRDLRIIKRSVDDVLDYPKRDNISMPLKGDLAVFTKPIIDYLKLLNPREELFKFRAGRAFQIVNHCTRIPSDDSRNVSRAKKDHDALGYMGHYIRAMGLKFRLRLYGMNVFSVQEYSGHARIDTLMDYLREIQDKESLTDYKMDEK